MGFVPRLQSFNTIFLSLRLPMETTTLVWICSCIKCFPHSSVGKESACNAGDLGSIPGLDTKSQTQLKQLSGGDDGLVSKLCPTLETPWIVVGQAPLSMGFSRQEYWSGLPWPLPRALLDPGIKPESLTSPALQVDSLPLAPPGKPLSLHANPN